MIQARKDFQQNDIFDFKISPDKGKQPIPEPCSKVSYSRYPGN